MKNPNRERQIDTLTLEEALAERQRLVRETMQHQDELGNRNRLGPDGKRLTSHDYWSWHRMTSNLLRTKQYRIGLLKERIRILRHEATIKDANVSDTSDLGLLRSAYNLLKTLAEEEVEFDQSELALMDLIRFRIQGNLIQTNGKV